jgi:hypothetical protein
MPVGSPVRFVSLHRQLRRYRFLLAAVAVVLAAAFLRVGTSHLVSAVVSGDAPGWLPRFGSVGRTVTNYLLAAQAVVVLVVPAAAFWLGSRHARATD